MESHARDIGSMERVPTNGDPSLSDSIGNCGSVNMRCVEYGVVGFGYLELAHLSSTIEYRLIKAIKNKQEK